MPLRRRALPDQLPDLIDLEAGQSQVLDNLLAKLAPGIVADVLFQEPTQQGLVAPDHEAD
jgi:hypothetical protein